MLLLLFDGDWTIEKDHEPERSLAAVPCSALASHEVAPERACRIAPEKRAPPRPAIVLVLVVVLVLEKCFTQRVWSTIDASSGLFRHCTPNPCSM